MNANAMAGEVAEMVPIAMTDVIPMGKPMTTAKMTPTTMKTNMSKLTMMTKTETAMMTTKTKIARIGRKLRCQRTLNISP